MDKFQIIQICLDFFVALGTIGAVIVALFQERIRTSKFFGPNLIIEIAEPHKVTCTHNKITTVTYMTYVFITNKGKVSARNVRAEIIKVEYEKDVYSYDFYIPWLLPWSTLKEKGESTPLYTSNINPDDTTKLGFLYSREDVPGAIYYADQRKILQFPNKLNIINNFESKNLIKRYSKINITLKITADNTRSQIINVFSSIEDNDYTSLIAYKQK